MEITGALFFDMKERNFMGRKVPYTFILVILTTAVFLVAQPVKAEDLFTKSHSGSVNPVEGPIIDLGLVNIDGGLVERMFELYNGGSEDLVLKGTFTSCMCTKASIELPDGTVSRDFGMKVPTDWIRVIEPGKRFKVHVKFDPAFHGKDGTGAFRRDIYLITSAAPDDFITSRLPMIRHGSVSKLLLKGKVVTAGEFRSSKPAPPPNKKIGDFRFPATSLDAGVIKQSSPITIKNQTAGSSRTSSF
jgi:hypothetical protein